MTEEDKISFRDRIHFAMISLMFDKLYRVFVNPYKMLEQAGVKEGQRVLEIGFGPGFFTLPTSKIVGERGSVFGLDINPIAIRTVQRKIEMYGIQNVDIVLADAKVTGLPDADFDLIFLFGVYNALDDVDAVMHEMHRVLKPGGKMVIQKFWKSKKGTIRDVTNANRFTYTDESKKMIHFSKGQS